MKKLTFQSLLVLLMLISVSCKTKKSNQIEGVSLLKLPIDFSFSINSIKLEGLIFSNEKEELNKKIEETFSFKQKANLIIEKELCLKYKEKCQLYFNSFEYSKTHKIDINNNFDLFLVTTQYNEYLTLVSIKNNQVLDVLNVYLDYLDMEGQESIFRSFTIEKDLSIKIYNYIYYEPIGEVFDEPENIEEPSIVYPQAKLKMSLYEINKDGIFIEK
ncbi:hypothetical protein A8C32_03715 [Flavivirga aquatica]|uniref:Lipoprotein n=1 Tax=Flavivirga aquatica TaxID=1849968 RepID=A0A1E5TB44_9FLAO|nr:hypothetical protein [Flavivirga aquatica]OEK08568.1 hypothetical protein A8C32_03715 [Flavivirga aquatica]